MDERPIQKLKTMLLRDVSYLCTRKDRLWSEAIAGVIQDIKQQNVDAVFFGGTLRSLLYSRLYRGRIGRPRDIDIVVLGSTMDELRGTFEPIVSRETRFGGIQLKKLNWQFDLWPLPKTWAFRGEGHVEPSFVFLPFTTFLNVEAIAVEIWAKPGHRRRVFAGNNQFFRGMLTRTLEINYPHNPFPELCVIRSLITAFTLDFYISPALAEYIVKYGEKLTPGEVDDIQRKHYGRRRQFGKVIVEWIMYISRYSGQGKRKLLLPIPRQGTFWPLNQSDYDLSISVI